MDEDLGDFCGIMKGSEGLPGPDSASFPMHREVWIYPVDQRVRVAAERRGSDREERTKLKMDSDFLICPSCSPQHQASG